MKRSVPILVVLSLLLSACGGGSKKTDFFGEVEKAKKPKIETSTRFKRNWRVDLGESIRPGQAIMSPAQLGDAIYAASSNGRIYRINSQTGKREWSIRLKKETITAGVGVGGGLVLFGTDQGIVYALRQQDGSVAWKSKLDSEILASPVTEGDVVVARSGDGKVYGLSSFDGERLWTISRQLPRLTIRGESRPLLTQGIVFAGFSDGYLVALEAKNGRNLWDFPIAFPRGTNEIDRLADIDTNPLLVGDQIYLSSYQEVTHALDIRNQRIAWSVDVSSYHALSADAAFLYISDRDGVVHQIERATGEKSWSQEGLRLFSISAPISLGGFVLVGEGDGNLYVIDKKNGQFLGKHSFGARSIVGEPIVEDDKVFLLDSDGALQSISIERREG